MQKLYPIELQYISKIFYLYFVLFQGKIAFGVLDVRKKEDWNQVWSQAETFFGGQVQVSWPVNFKFESPFF